MEGMARRKRSIDLCSWAWAVAAPVTLAIFFTVAFLSARIIGWLFSDGQTSHHLLPVIGIAVPFGAGLVRAMMSGRRRVGELLVYRLSKEEGLALKKRPQKRCKAVQHREIVDSTPTPWTIFERASPSGKAPGFQPGTHGFESHRQLHNNEADGRLPPVPDATIR